MSTGTRLVYCHCAYAQVVPADVKRQVLEGLSASAAAFEAVPDLCEMSARRDPRLHEIAAGGEAVLVACYPRAVRWLFNAAGAPLPDTGIRILNMRIDDGRAILNAIAAGGDMAGCAAEPASEQS